MSWQERRFPCEVRLLPFEVKAMVGKSFWFFFRMAEDIIKGCNLPSLIFSVGLFELVSM